MDTKRIIPVIIAIFLIVGTLSLTGCLEDDEDDTETLTIAIAMEPSDFHPVRYTAGAETGQFLAQIFDPLLASWYEGEPTAEEKSIARDFEILDDGMRYRFHIKEDVVFHNGDPLTAEDVAFSIDTMMMGEDRTAEYMDKWDVDGNQISPRQGDWEFADYVEVVDDYTVDLYMEELNVEFLVSSGFENMRIIPLNYIQENGWDQFDDTLIGTGPYEFVEYRRGDRMEFKRFEDSHVEANIDRIIVDFYDELPAAITALRAGEVDFVSRLEPSQYRDLENEPGVVRDAYDLGGSMFIAFNHAEGPTTDVRVRKAIAYAIDVQTIIDAIRVPELAVDSRALVDPSHPAAADDLITYEQDLQKAQDLLDEAGYEDGLELSMYAWEGSQDPMVLFQDQLGDIGLEISITTLEWGGFMDAMQAAEPDLMYTGWPGAASADYMMGWMVQDDPYIHWALYYDSPEYTDFVDRANREADFEERMELYREAQRVNVNEEMGLFNLWWESEPFAYRDNLNIPEHTIVAYNDGPITHVHQWQFE